MSEQLAELKADMAHTALEGAPPLPAVLIGKEFEVRDCRYVQDRGDCLFLLALVRNACRNRLKGCNITLP